MNQSSANDRIANNLAGIRSRVQAAAKRAGRDPAAIRVIAVTKSVGPTEAAHLRELGIQEMGENRVEVAAPKIAALGQTVRWHMIGPIQRRKAREVARHFDFADAIDRLEVAEALQRRLEECDRSLEALIEVNVSGDEAKHGFPPDALPRIIEEARVYDRLRFTGLMTMAPFDAPEAEIRGYFRRLRALADENGLPECSMGMTDDFEIGIEEGATQVRIGRALFE